MNEDLLAGLRDVQIPPPVSFWPPAPGWWILVLLCFGFLMFLGWYFIITWERKRLLKEARLQLEKLEYRYLCNNNSKDAFREISTLTRRMVLTLSNDKRVAGIQGSSWLDFLVYLAGESSNKTGPLKLLLENPYRIHVVDNPLELIEALKNWLRGIPLREKFLCMRIKNWFDRKWGS